MADPERIERKRIVYLVGAGATQAEVEELGATRLNLLMHDSERLGGEGVSAGVLKRAGAEAVPFLADQGLDIEKLISLLVLLCYESSSCLRRTTTGTTGQPLKQRTSQELVRGGDGRRHMAFRPHRECPAA